jgi:hypothetical protein
MEIEMGVINKVSSLSVQRITRMPHLVFSSVFKTHRKFSTTAKGI